jgi:hypothetical protein
MLNETAPGAHGVVVVADTGARGDRGDAVWSDCSRLYLTDDAIAAMAAEGAVRLAAVDAAPTVVEATARAVEAYRRGVFVMFTGASQVGGIDESVRLQDGDRVVLLRLSFGWWLMWRSGPTEPRSTGSRSS